MLARPGGFVRPYSSGLAILQRLLDVLVIAGSLELTSRLFNVPLHFQYWLAITWAIMFFLLVAEVRNIYSSWRMIPLKEEVFQLFVVWLIVVFGLVCLAFTTKTSIEFSRRVILSWFALTPAFLFLQRALIRKILWELRARGRNTRALAIAGAGKLGREVAKKVLQAGWLGLRLVGFYDDHKAVGFQPLVNEPVIIEGTLDDLVARACSGGIDYIYITLPMRAEKRISDLVTQLADSTASVYIVPTLFVSDLTHAQWSNLDGIPIVGVFDSPFYGVNGWLKRLEDIVLSVLILAVIWIPMLIIAIALKLCSPGPVLFKQRRYGLNGKVVEVWKFRTMTVCEDGDKIPQATKHDLRIMPFGAFLRRTSLDELPQFINVLQGYMSIVGPRPHAVAHNEQYRRLIHGYMLRHKVKPGITGWAQVNGWRGETDTLEKMQKRVEYDLEYMREWSLWLDLKIVFLTVVRGFSDKNAY